MDHQEPLSLPHTFKSTHDPLSNSRRLMGKFCSVISILTGIMNRVRDELSMCDPIASQLVRHYLSGFHSMLLTINLQEDLINEECISISLVLLLSTTNIFQTELIAPQTNCLIANGDSTFSQQVFDISMAEIESMIEPNCVLNDFRRKSVTLVHRRWSFHPTITL